MPSSQTNKTTEINKT
uniref:Uncharacterized protein n=1 Tax=Rhizophora mucronata TaxID=61149 RepID=A0A2P2PHP7_RHIMU